MQIRIDIPAIANGVLTMSKITGGIVLFSLLMALSLGVAFAESEVAADGNATESNNTSIDNNNTTAINVSDENLTAPENVSAENTTAA